MTLCLLHIVVVKFHPIKCVGLEFSQATSNVETHTNQQCSCVMNVLADGGGMDVHVLCFV